MLLEPVMLRVSMLFSCFLFVACNTTEGSDPENQSADSSTQSNSSTNGGTGGLIFDDIAAPALEDNLLGDSPEKGVAVYLPPSYQNAEKRYPVIYFLPGYGVELRTYIDGSLQNFSLPESMDDRIAGGAISEMIFVIVEGQHNLGGSFYVNSPVTGNWEDFIVDDLVGYVDSSYRTIPAAAARGIAGHSMGGFGALDLAMRHPDIFSAVYSMSPGLFDPDGLSNSQMFASQDAIDRFLELEAELAGLSGEEAHDVLIDRTLSETLEFTVNYGMAFSPNTQKNAPYIDYPYHLEGDSLVLDNAVWRLWEVGFGGTDDKINAYHDNLSSLAAIAVDWGTNDYYRWIPQGCEYYAQQLDDVGIPHTAATHDGGHMDEVGNRIDQYMLPFFSDSLSVE